MTKIVVSIFIIMLFVFSKPLLAQVSVFDTEHHQLLEDYVLFIDSVEKKQAAVSYFEIYKRKHVSKVEFRDGLLVYQIYKKIKIYKSGTRYEKIDWSIRYPNKRWHHKIYEIKQVGTDYRFIEQISYEFGKKLKPTKIITSIDDNYLRVKVMTPKDKKGTYLLVKPNSSLPDAHQN